MDNEEFDMILFLFLRLRKSRQNVKKERRFWIRKIFEKEEEIGEYHQLFQELNLGDRENFCMYVL